MFTVYGYVANGGDGSYDLCWFSTEGDEERLVGCEYETWCDGDGFGPTSVLNFESKEAAIAAGIPADIGPFTYMRDDEPEEMEFE